MQRTRRPKAARLHATRHTRQDRLSLARQCLATTRTWHSGILAFMAMGYGTNSNFQFQFQLQLQFSFSPPSTTIVPLPLLLRSPFLTLEESGPADPLHSPLHSFILQTIFSFFFTQRRLATRASRSLLAHQCRRASLTHYSDSMTLSSGLSRRLG
jgi:hypothetical protein